MTLWSGRVGGELAPEVWQFLKADDAELLPYDCAATSIHAQRLHEAGLLTSEELTEVQTALDRIAAEGTVDEADEDVHSAIERLQRRAQHQRLVVEPASLVEEAPEPAAGVGVLLERRLVVDRRQQPLVGDVQERQPGRLVDAAALRLDDAVLDLVGHAKAVAAADRVRRPQQRNRVALVLVAVDRDRHAVLEADRRDLGLDLEAGVPVRDAHDRLDDLHARPEQL